MNKYGQSKKLSMIETIISVISNMIMIFCFVQFIAGPLLGLDIQPSDNLFLTVTITVLSAIRHYIFRRLFNKIEAYENLIQDNLELSREEIAAIEDSLSTCIVAAITYDTDAKVTAWKKIINIIETWNTIEE